MTASVVEHEDVDGAVDGDEAQDVAVAEHRTPQRELDLVAGWHPVAGRCLGRLVDAARRRNGDTGTTGARLPPGPAAESSGPIWATSVPTRA